MEISLEKVKYLRALAKGAVTQEEVAYYRRNVRIGDPEDSPEICPVSLSGLLCL